MARKTKEEALETRNRLLDAAEDVFYRDGYARTSLDAVAEAAGLTRGAVYWHFKNKSDIFNAMCDRVRLPMEELADADQPGEQANPLDHLRKVCVFFLKECEHNPHLRKVMDILFCKTEFVDPSDLMYVRQHEAFFRGRERITRTLSLAVEGRHLPQDMDLRFAAIVFQASIEGTLLSWLIAADQFSIAQEAERLVDTWIATLRSAPGLRSS